MIPRPEFAILKNHYQLLPHQVHSCSMHFPNTCAIRMSEALVKTNDAFLNAFRQSGKNVCPHGYVRGAQDLAAVLESPQVFGVRDQGWYGQQGGNTPANIRRIKGIVCYMNIPGFDGQGHIDLWDGQGAFGTAYWEAHAIWMWRLI